MGWSFARCCFAQLSLRATSSFSLSAYGSSSQHSFSLIITLQHQAASMHVLRGQGMATPADAANSKFLTVYSWPQYTFAWPGSLLSLPTKALYICSGVPTKHLQEGAQ